MTDQPEAWRTDPRERLLTAIDRTWARGELGATPEQLVDGYAHHLAEQRSLALDYLDSLHGQKITETDRQRLLRILDDGRLNGPTCGKTQATDGNTYPPCARPKGHVDAYCRDATRNAYFITSGQTNAPA
ncbi:hypothetical protein QBA79_36405 [Streptomyces scabiei]|uniref:hypothetical protein n=1 Tax=Streptomyces scabiei TaxID=1930 RepID=UPI0029BE3495|nr:hypothetical protein [Streptomyces scabiei]MDX2532318.1 hypothetical protein [Streptomyces scabiei]